MALSYQTIDDDPIYLQLAFGLISKVEGLRKEAYLDTANIPCDAPPDYAASLNPVIAANWQ
ncbi:MAG: hypothetical protein ACREVD_09430 [Burkholderiales bacterium]